MKKLLAVFLVLVQVLTFSVSPTTATAESINLVEYARRYYSAVDGFGGTTSEAMFFETDAKGTAIDGPYVMVCFDDKLAISKVSVMIDTKNEEQIYKLLSAVSALYMTVGDKDASNYSAIMANIKANANGDHKCLGGYSIGTWYTFENSLLATFELK